MLTFFGDTKVQWQTKMEKTRLCNKVTRLGRKTKTHAAEGRVTLLLDSLGRCSQITVILHPLWEIFSLYDTVFNLLTTPERDW